MGAFVASAMWEVAKRVFSFYAVSFGTFDRYSGIDKLGDLLGLIVGIVFWVYYSGLVFIIGAMLTALHQDRARVVEEAQRGALPASAPPDEQQQLPESAAVEPIPVAAEGPEA